MASSSASTSSAIASIASSVSTSKKRPAEQIIIDEKEQKEKKIKIESLDSESDRLLVNNGFPFHEEFKSNIKHSDVIITIVDSKNNGFNIHSSKYLLSQNSEFFDKLISSNFAENKNNCYQLKCNDLGDAIYVFKLIHPQFRVNISGISAVQIEQIMILADMWLIPNVVRKCIDSLYNKKYVITIQMLDLAQKYYLTQYNELLGEYIRSGKSNNSKDVGDIPFGDICTIATDFKYDEVKTSNVKVLQDLCARSLESMFRYKNILAKLKPQSIKNNNDDANDDANDDDNDDNDDDIILYSNIDKVLSSIGNLFNLYSRHV